VAKSQAASFKPLRKPQASSLKPQGSLKLQAANGTIAVMFSGPAILEVTNGAPSLLKFGA
jgi:hypothetical protein